MLFAKIRNKKKAAPKKEHITVSGLPVEVWWKTVKRINLVVYRKNGRVRISVPLSTPMGKVVETILARMAWINTQQEKFREQKPAVELHYTTGELHSFLGAKYPLFVVEGGRRHYVRFDSLCGIALHIRRNSTLQQRQNVLLQWYREQLLLRIPSLQEKWQPKIGEKVSEFRIKRMKTRWGTCNIPKRRIWLNLELIRKPEQCLEYIVVHEMVHLLEPGHTKKFYAHLDDLLPEWRSVDLLLKQEN